MVSGERTCITQGCFGPQNDARTLRVQFVNVCQMPVIIKKGGHGFLGQILLNIILSVTPKTLYLRELVTKHG